MPSGKRERERGRGEERRVNSGEGTTAVDGGVAVNYEEEGRTGGKRKGGKKKRKRNKPIGTHGRP